MADTKPSDAEIERAARAIEKFRTADYEWNDEEFELWWTQDPQCKRDKVRAWAKCALLARGSAAAPAATKCPRCHDSGWVPNIDAEGNRVWLPLMNDALPCPCGALARNMKRERESAAPAAPASPDARREKLLQEFRQILWDEFAVQSRSATERLVDAAMAASKEPTRSFGADIPTGTKP